MNPSILKTGRSACHYLPLTSSLHRCHWLRSARSALQRSGFVRWHPTDMTPQRPHVRCWGMNGLSSDVTQLPFLTHLGLGRDVSSARSSTALRSLFELGPRLSVRFPERGTAFVVRISEFCWRPSAKTDPRTSRCVESCMTQDVDGKSGPIPLHSLSAWA